MLSRFLLLLALCGAVGCNNPKSLPLTAESFASLDEGDLTEEESALVASYMMRQGLASAFSGDEDVSIEDPTVTIGEAIDAQRAWAEAEAQRLGEEQAAAEQALAEREAELARLRALVTVSAVEKDFVEYRYDDAIVMTVAIANNTERDVAGVKGALILNDMFGDRIVGIEIKHDDPISAGERAIETMSYDYNQFMDEHNTWRATDLDKMQIAWEPEMVIYSDGERIEL